MSRKRRLPPMGGDTPENLAGKRFYAIEEIRVAEYHDLPDGRGLPTAVTLLLTISNVEIPLIFRMKSAQACDELVAMILRHRKNVWPAEPDHYPEIPKP